MSIAFALAVPELSSSNSKLSSIFDFNSKRLHGRTSSSLFLLFLFLFPC